MKNKNIAIQEQKNFEKLEIRTIWAIKSEIFKNSQGSSEIPFFLKKT